MSGLSSILIIWIFGLRNQPDQPACYQLLQCLNKLFVKTPHQIFLELQANLNPEEMKRFFRLIHLYPNRIELSWGRTMLDLSTKYRNLGCKFGDAIIASHMEVMSIKTLVSENRDFFEETKGLPFRVLRAEEALHEIEVAG